MTWRAILVLCFSYLPSVWAQPDTGETPAPAPASDPADESAAPRSDNEPIEINPNTGLPIKQDPSETAPANPDAKDLTPLKTTHNPRLTGGVSRWQGIPPLLQGELYGGDVSYKIGGFIRLLARWQQNDDQVAFLGRSDGFALQNARLAMNIKWRRKVTFAFSFDGAGVDRAGPSDTRGELAFSMRDAFADFHLDDYFELRVGRFKPIFDMEEYAATSQMMFINRSVSSRGVAVGEGWVEPGLGVARDLGIAIHSAAPRTKDLTIGYELAVMNGENDTVPANYGDMPAISGAGTLHTGDFFGFIAARYNGRLEGTFPNQREERIISASVGARYTGKKFYAAAQGILARTTFETSGSSPELSLSGHAEAMIAMPGTEPQSLWIGGRYAILDPSDLISTDRVHEFTGGVMLDLPNLRSNIFLNYTYPLEQSGRVLANQRIEALWQVFY